MSNPTYGQHENVPQQSLSNRLRSPDAAEESSAPYSFSPITVDYETLPDFEYSSFPENSTELMDEQIQAAVEAFRNSSNSAQTEIGHSGKNDHELQRQYSPQSTATTTLFEASRPADMSITPQSQEISVFHNPLSYSLHSGLGRHGRQNEQLGISNVPRVALNNMQSVPSQYHSTMTDTIGNDHFGPIQRSYLAAPIDSRFQSPYPASNTSCQEASHSLSNQLTAVHSSPSEFHIDAGGLDRTRISRGPINDIERRSPYFNESAQYSTMGSMKTPHVHPSPQLSSNNEVFDCLRKIRQTYPSQVPNTAYTQYYQNNNGVQPTYHNLGLDMEQTSYGNGQAEPELPITSNLSNFRFNAAEGPSTDSTRTVMSFQNVRNGGFDNRSSINSDRLIDTGIAGLSRANSSQPNMFLENFPRTDGLGHQTRNSVDHAEFFSLREPQDTQLNWSRERIRGKENPFVRDTEQIERGRELSRIRPQFETEEGKAAKNVLRVFNGIYSSSSDSGDDSSPKEGSLSLKYRDKSKSKERRHWTKLQKAENNRAESQRGVNPSNATKRRRSTPTHEVVEADDRRLEKRRRDTEEVFANLTQSRAEASHARTADRERVEEYEHAERGQSNEKRRTVREQVASLNARNTPHQPDEMHKQAADIPEGRTKAKATDGRIDTDDLSKRLTKPSSSNSHSSRNAEELEDSDSATDTNKYLSGKKTLIASESTAHSKRIEYVTIIIDSDSEDIPISTTNSKSNKERKKTTRIPREARSIKDQAQQEEFNGKSKNVRELVNTLQRNEDSGEAAVGENFQKSPTMIPEETVHDGSHAPVDVENMASQTPIQSNVASSHRTDRQGVKIPKPAVSRNVPLATRSKAKLKPPLTVSSNELHRNDAPKSKSQVTFVEDSRRLEIERRHEEAASKQEEEKRRIRNEEKSRKQIEERLRSELYKTKEVITEEEFNRRRDAKMATRAEKLRKRSLKKDSATSQVCETSENSKGDEPCTSQGENTSEAEISQFSRSVLRMRERINERIASSDIREAFDKAAKARFITEDESEISEEDPDEPTNEPSVRASNNDWGFEQALAEIVSEASNKILDGQATDNAADEPVDESDAHQTIVTRNRGSYHVYDNLVNVYTVNRSVYRTGKVARTAMLGNFTDRQEANNCVERELTMSRGRDPHEIYERHQKIDKTGNLAGVVILGATDPVKIHIWTSRRCVIREDLDNDKKLILPDLVQEKLYAVMLEKIRLDENGEEQILHTTPVRFSADRIVANQMAFDTLTDAAKAMFRGNTTVLHKYYFAWEPRFREQLANSEEEDELLCLSLDYEDAAEGKLKLSAKVAEHLIEGPRN